MTKIPTPAQARVLRDLAAEYNSEYAQPHLRIWVLHDGENITNINSVWRSEVKARVSTATAKVLIDNQWIEKVKTGVRFEGYYISAKGRAALDKLSEADFISPPPTGPAPLWNTDEIRAALFDKYRRANKRGYTGAPVWIYFSELGDQRFAQRRVDFWAMACWESKQYEKISYEIKISRADFLNELRNPHKREFALSISNRYYFVTPPDLISLDELPPEAGLMELEANGQFFTKKKAPHRNPPFVFTWDFAATLGRQIFLAGEARKNK